MIECQEIHKLSDIEILKKSSIMTRYLKIKLKNLNLLDKEKNCTNFYNIVESLKWLKNNMSILSERIGQGTYNDKITSDTLYPKVTINRNSYKFCDSWI